MDCSKYVKSIIDKPENNFVVIGCVQSGKTKFIIELTTKLLSIGKKVIILTRNSLNDLSQLQARLPKDISSLESLFLTMANVSRLDKLFKDIKQKNLSDFVLISDESDMIFKDPSRKFNKAFKNISSRVSQNVYVSATNITCLFKVRNKSIIYLPPPVNYTGVDSINIKHDMENEFEPYKEIFKLKSSLVLHKTTPKIKEQNSRASNISKLNKSAVCCTFNCLGYTLFINGEKIRVIDKKIPLSSVITTLTNDYNHVVIVAGHIAGRGLSFVSEDYTKHLTHQVMILGKKSRGDTIVQSLRLLGVFTSGDKPALYTDYQSYEEIMKYLNLQEVLYKKGNPVESENETLYNISFKGEIPKRKTIYNNHEKVIIKKTNGKKITLSLANAV